MKVVIDIASDVSIRDFDEFIVLFHKDMMKYKHLVRDVRVEGIKGGK